MFPGPNLAHLLLDLSAFQQLRLGQGQATTSTIACCAPVEGIVPIAPNPGEEV